MRIAVFNYVIAPHSGPGSRDAEVLEQLRSEHEFTVFASKLVLPDGDKDEIEYVPVRTLPRPAFPSFVLYFVGACLSYARRRLKRTQFDLLHVTDASFP